jgi:hypothetical protein
VEAREFPGETEQSPIEGAPLSMWWGRELFLSVDVPDGRCPTVIDVTGRARILSFGPYAPLGLGPWRARVVLDLCPDAARCRLALQFGLSTDFTTVDVPRGAPGRREIELDYFCETPGLAEVRLVLMRAAFHGEVQLHGVDILAINSSPY